MCVCVGGGGGGGGGCRGRGGGGGGVVDTNDWCTTIVPEISIANFCSYKQKFLQITYLVFLISTNP